MRIVYAGTPDFAVEPLKRLISEGLNVVGVITQTDKPQGRKGIITPSPVKVCALENNIPVYQFEKIRNDVEALKNINADIMVTCAYGQILTQEVLDCFKRGVWNIHASLLPKYRGAAPIQWSILNGDEYTGVTIMKTELGLDTGGMLLVKRLKIEDGENAGELSQRLSVLSADAIIEALKLIEEGDTQLLLQDEAQATVVKKITKEQAKISFDDTAENIVNKIRAMNPSPVAFACLEGKSVNLYKAEVFSCEDNGENGEVLYDSPKKGLVVKCCGGAVKILELQLPGSKKMGGGDVLNGRKIAKGQRFE